VRKTFRGRPILAGNVEGQALVTRLGFNTYASFFTSMYAGEKAAKCSDKSNPELYGEIMTDKIICLPNTVGSTSSGATWPEVAQLNIAPRAMLFSQKIDSLAAGGLVVTDVWAGKRIFAVDQLGDSFLEFVKNGDRIVIKENGTITIEQGSLSLRS
jgi:predicted aconitase with swiveling domain